MANDSANTRGCQRTGGCPRSYCFKVLTAPNVRQRKVQPQMISSASDLDRLLMLQNEPLMFCLKWLCHRGMNSGKSWQSSMLNIMEHTAVLSACSGSTPPPLYIQAPRPVPTADTGQQSLLRVSPVFYHLWLTLDLSSGELFEDASRRIKQQNAPHIPPPSSTLRRSLPRHYATEIIGARSQQKTQLRGSKHPSPSDMRH